MTDKTDAQILQGVAAVLKNDGLDHRLVVGSRIKVEWLKQDGAEGLGGVVDVYDRQRQNEIIGQFELNRDGSLIIGIRGYGLIDALAQAWGRHHDDLLAQYESRRAAFCAADQARREAKSRQESQAA